MRNHTAAHLLQAALRKELGTHVEQAGQLVNSDYVRFDFTHFSALTGEELKKVEDDVNDVILSALKVTTAEMPIEEAKKMGAMALFGEKYGNIVRVVKAGDFSTELCGGTHVSDTGAIGLFRIVSESSVASGVRRIEAVTGKNVIKLIREKEKLISSASSALKLDNTSALAERAVSVAAELKEKDREIEKLKAEIAANKTGDLLSKAVDVNGVKVACVDLGESEAGEVRSVMDQAKTLGDNVVVIAAAVNKEKGTVSFGCTCGKSAVKSGAHAGNIVREIAKIAGGNGGGKPDSAMAGGKDITKASEALSRAAEIVGTFVK